MSNFEAVTLILKKKAGICPFFREPVQDQPGFETGSPGILMYIEKVEK
jgi:hypothetical protein